jgi:hypothetical protein
MPIKLNGSTSGSVTVQAPAVAGTNTLTLPAATGNLLSDQSIVPGSASVPTNGMYLPATNALGFATNSTNAVYIDASQNVGIGTTSPAQKITVNSANTSTNSLIAYQQGGTTYGYSGLSSVNRLQFESNGCDLAIQTDTANVIQFVTNAVERMRIDSSGNLLVGTTSTNPAGSRVNGAVIGAGGTVYSRAASQSYFALSTTSGSNIGFFTDNGSALVTAGSISSNGSTTSFNTSSDYRLKENITPLTTGLATINALKPINYVWVGNQEKGEGFIAHELAEIIPLAVTGEKDAVNEDGSIKPQGVDYSKIVVHLVAAIKELSAKNDALEARLVALEAK